MVDLFFLFSIATVSVAIGLKFIRWIGPTFHSRAEELIFSSALGLGVLSLSIMLLGFLHLLYVEVLYGLVLVPLVLGRKELVGLLGRIQGVFVNTTIPYNSMYFWLLLLVFIGIAMNLTRALTPAHGAVDPLAYHLALPKIYLSKHHISFERTITGSLYPDNIGMLYLLGIGLRGAVLAQAIHWLMGVLSLLAIWGASRDWFNERVGRFAGVIYVFTPVFVFYSPLAYIDVGVSLFQFMGIWALAKWMSNPDNKILGLCACFIGFSIGSKHTALFLAVAILFIIFFLLVKKKGTVKEIFSTLLIYGSISVILVLPWYLRSYFEAGNPIWPLAQSVFGGLPYGSTYNVPGLSSNTVDMGRVKDLLYIIPISIWEWTWNHNLGWQRAIGVYFISLIPLALFHLKEIRFRLLFFVSFCYYVMTVLYIDGNPRYNLVLFLLLSIVTGFCAEKISAHRIKPVGVIFKLTLFITIFLNLAQLYALSYKSLNFVFSHQRKENFLLENEGNYRVFNFVNKNLPLDSKVLLQGIVKGYYCEREYMWDHPYQRVLSYQDYDNSELLIEKMKDLRITHIVRMISIPQGRLNLGIPQYFLNPYHENFRKKYLKLIYKDESYVVFELNYPSRLINVE